MTERGFPDGARTTPVPDLVFSRVLRDEADATALKLLLHVIWRIHRRPAGTPPAISLSALVGDDTLRRGVAALGAAEADVEPAIARAVDHLVAAGVLLDVWLPGDSGPTRWLVVNGREGRAALARLRRGGVVPAATVSGAATPTGPRANVFVLYEENIGLVTPLLAEALADAEATYPPGWIADAIRLAVDNNARKWAYVRAILERWAREGRSDGTDRQGVGETRARDSEGPYADWVRH